MGFYPQDFETWKMSYFEGKMGMNNPLVFQSMTMEGLDAQESVSFIPPKKTFDQPNSLKK